MTVTRQEAIRMLEKVPEDKLSYVVQIMSGINGLLGTTEATLQKNVELDRFVMLATERGQDADNYIREFRDNEKDNFKQNKNGGKIMGERLTWEEMHEKYPDRWLGLVDVKFRNDDGVSVESAVVKYTDKTKTELGFLTLNESVVPEYMKPGVFIH